MIIYDYIEFADGTKLTYSSTASWQYNGQQLMIGNNINSTSAITTKNSNIKENIKIKTLNTDTIRLGGN